MWNEDACHENGRLPSFPLTEHTPTYHNDCIESNTFFGVTSGNKQAPTLKTASGTVLHKNPRKRLSPPPTQDIPCILGGDREHRRTTGNVHSLPIILFFTSYFEKSMCSLLRLPFTLLFFSLLLFSHFSLQISTESTTFFIHAS